MHWDGDDHHCILGFMSAGLVCLCGLLYFLPGLLGADPTLIGPANTCLSCHVFTPASGGLSIDFINSITATAAPYSVTVVAGASFTLQFRSTGLYTTGFYSDTGGAIVPPDTANWTISTGPAWSDNGHLGATPWMAPNALFYRTDFSNVENVSGFPGLTTNNGQASAPVDKNGLASDEVMSATISLASSLAAGTYPVTVAAMGHSLGNEVAWTQVLSVIVVAPTPTCTPSISPTFSVSPTLAGTFTVSPTTTQTFTHSPTATATPAVAAPVPSAHSFTSVLNPVIGPNPVLGSQAHVYYQLLAAAENIQVRLYTRAMVLVLNVDYGTRPAGANLEALDIPEQLKNQIYFLQLRARSGVQEITSPALKLVLLR
jgi:hypothetical protein